MREDKAERYIREYEEAGDNYEKALAEVKRVFYETSIGKRVKTWKPETWLKICLYGAILYLIAYIVLIIAGAEMTPKY